MVEGLYDWLTKYAMNRARFDTQTGNCSLMEYFCANWTYKPHPCRLRACEAGAKTESTSAASVVVRLANEEVGELLLAVLMPKALLPGRCWLVDTTGGLPINWPFLQCAEPEKGY